MSMYTLGSTPSPSYSSPAKTEIKEKEEEEEKKETSKGDMYANLDSDTAALLF